VKSRKPDVYSAKLFLENSINVFAVFGGVCEAACVVKLWGLLEGRGYWSGRRGRFSNGAVDLILNKHIVCTIGKGCI
jgi:hypothetical protein